MRHRMKAKLTATVNYGPIKAGREYDVVGQGRDWFAVKIRGGVMQVFRWVFFDD